MMPSTAMITRVNARLCVSVGSTSRILRYSFAFSPAALSAASFSTAASVLVPQPMVPHCTTRRVFRGHTHSTSAPLRVGCSNYVMASSAVSTARQHRTPTAR